MCPKTILQRFAYSAILKLSGQTGESGFTTAKEATTKMDRRTRIRKKRSPAEETGVKYR